MRSEHTITSITLVTKAGLKEAGPLCEEIAQWLRARGVPARRFVHPTDSIPDCLGPERDLILVLGGDGTVVSVSRRTLGMGMPIAGVNFGRVGFLTGIMPDNWREPLTRMLDNGLPIEPRMSLRYTLYREGRPFYQGEVVNDVVVTRGKLARLATLELGVNGEPFVTLRSDGLILSTPTGASGYAGSAGGPLLVPTINAYIVAAICPYLSGFPPLVLRDETLFSVRVPESTPDLYLTLDGQEAHEMAEGDRLEVRGEPGRLLMADFGLKDYFERLCRAGFVQGVKTSA